MTNATHYVAIYFPAKVKIETIASSIKHCGLQLVDNNMSSDPLEAFVRKI